MTEKKAIAADGATPKKKKSNGKGTGLKQRHRFTKPDGRTLDILYTEAKGQYNVRAKHINGEETNTGAVLQTADKAEAEQHYAGLVEDAKGKGWQSRKAGVLSSAFDELPD